jgi:ABC-2 type transport system permease protein
VTARLVRLVLFEWQKLIARRLAIVALVVVALAAAISPLAGHVVDVASALSAGKAAPTTDFQNGWTTLASGVRSGLFLVTVTLLVFAGSSISEEAQQGTLKALFLRPLRRTELLLAKWIALSGFAVLLLLVMTGSAALAGFAQHQSFGPVVDPAYPDAPTTKTVAYMLTYTVPALLLVIPGLVAVVSFALLFSCAIDHPGYSVGASIASFLLLGALAALSTTAARILFPHYVGLSLEQLSDIAEQFSSASKEFRQTALTTGVVPAVSSVVFFGAAAFLLGSRDVGD